MFKNKSAFWVAFIIAFFVFWFGILLGITFEKSRIDEVKNFYFESETQISDFELTSNIIKSSNMSCSMIYQQSIIFADRIFKEASKLEKYDDSNKLTPELIYLHRRYDLLRTVLWMDLIKAEEKCGKMNVIVYLYNYIDPSLTTKATQGTMSNFLVELKKKYEDKIILIPIAADTGVDSIQILRDLYGLDNIPTILVNGKIKIDDLDQIKDFDESIFSDNRSVIKLSLKK